ncbi:uncharacterized protein Cpr11A isoform X2 [Eurosta solidaginis]|uniref:uncharacterized protein Cpr11A isoform X2 n=1 Tax=Eurosta solidaginis TaxID=178769 RepID=UPI003530ACFF
MKLVILFSFFVHIVAGGKQAVDRNIDLFKYDPKDLFTLPQDVDDEKPAVIFDGNVMKAKVEKLQSFNGNKKFKLDLKTQNGIEVTSVGKLRDDKTFVVSGSYSFTGVDGKRYKTRYTADEFGYHPITELDLDIPDPQSADVPAERLNAIDTSKGLLRSFKNRFQFLNQNFDLDINIRGNAESGEDNKYFSAPIEGYRQHLPILPAEPFRKYLPTKE